LLKEQTLTLIHLRLEGAGRLHPAP